MPEFQDVTVTDHFTNRGSAFFTGFSRVGPLAIQGELTLTNIVTLASELRVNKVDGRTLAETVKVGTESAKVEIGNITTPVESKGNLIVTDGRMICMGSTAATSSKVLAVTMKAGEALGEGVPVKIVNDLGEPTVYQYLAADAQLESPPLVAGINHTAVNVGENADVCLSGVCMISLAEGDSVSVGDYVQPSLIYDATVYKAAKSSETIATTLAAATGTAGGSTKVPVLLK